MSEKNDRRIRKSKEALKYALLELMNDKPVISITVKELVNVADLNRSTFYNYYSDVPQMLESLEDELYREILSTLDANILNRDLGTSIEIRLHNFVKDICDVIKNNYNICKCIFRHNRDINFLPNLEA